MATTTPRLNLTKPAGTETVSIGTLNTNFDKIDAGGNGSYVCTSAARPGSPFTGMMIYETDTALTRLWNGTDWVYIAGPMHVEFTHTGSSIPSGGSGPSGIGTITPSAGYSTNDPGFTNSSDRIHIPNPTNKTQVWMLQWTCTLSTAIGASRAFIQINTGLITTGAVLARNGFEPSGIISSVSVNIPVPPGTYTSSYGVFQNTGATITAIGSIRCSRIS